MSLFSLLGIARSALLVHQRAMSVTSHNIANANTPGYSRQRLDLTAEAPVDTLYGFLGRGVTASGVTRARDRLLDAAYRRQASLLGDSSTRYDVLSQVEGAIGEPSDLGVSASLDHLFQSVGDLANDPSSGTSRELVRQNAKRFIQQVRQLDARLSEIRSDTLTRLQGQVGEVNSLVEKIGQINQQILAGGGAAPDLEDQRDVMVDQLSSFLGIEVQAREDGTIGVTAGGVTLVDGTQVQALSIQAQPGGRYAITTTSGTTLATGNGSFSGLIDLLSTTLPDVSNRLDTFVRGLVTEFNNLHRQGYTLTGRTRQDFFDPTGVTAGTIALSAGVDASGDAIAAAGSPSPGDGSNALLLSQLNDTTIGSLGGRSFREYYMDIASVIGIGVQNSSQDVEIHTTLVDQADNNRSAVSGVSLDEEMVLLIGQQEAYQAASRIIRMADDMIQDLLNMV